MSLVHGNFILSLGPANYKPERPGCHWLSLFMFAVVAVTQKKRNTALLSAAMQREVPELHQMKLGAYKIQMKVDDGCCFHFFFFWIGQYSIGVACDSGWLERFSVLCVCWIPSRVVSSSLQNGRIPCDADIERLTLNEGYINGSHHVSASRFF